MSCWSLEIDSHLVTGFHVFASTVKVTSVNSLLPNVTVLSPNTTASKVKFLVAHLSWQLINMFKMILKQLNNGWSTFYILPGAVNK